ncbi:MAG: ABC transporter ATP-binding protein [Tomitella sp.]|nr:ABC transporter ATP-binding protein [Tomitella sp.]
MSTVGSATALPAIEVRGARLRFGQVVAFSDVSFDVAQGELFAIIGPNGAGKTSLFNSLSRVYQPDAGTLRFHGDDLLRKRPKDLAGLGIARTFQNLALYASLPVLENVLIGRHHLMRAGPVSGGIWLGRARNEERRHRAAALDALRFVGIEELATRPVSTLPYGLRKRVELARALAMEPRLLLLDEPVAGMESSERAEMSELVSRMHRERGLTILLVEHDMGMVMKIAERVLVLDFGRTIAVGSPAEIQRDERVIKAYLGVEFEEAAP